MCQCSFACLQCSFACLRRRLLLATQLLRNPCLDRNGLRFELPSIVQRGSWNELPLLGTLHEFAQESKRMANSASVGQAGNFIEHVLSFCNGAVLQDLLGRRPYTAIEK